MRSASWIALSFVTVGAVVLACGSSNERSGFDPNQSSGGPGSSSGASSGVIGGPEAGGPGGPGCVPTKGAYDFPGNNCDDDDDGTVDNPPTCDSAVGGNDGEDLAKAMGVCTKAADAGYGLVKATITRGNGQTPSPNQHSVMAKFGDVVKPREGSKLVVLSTGFAQEYNGAANAPFGGEEKGGGGIFNLPKQYGKGWGSNNQGAAGSLPAGFPKAASGCDQDNKVFDVVNVKLEMKAPANAAGVKFDFNFFSGEWPAYICSRFNDGFIAYLSSPGFNKGTPDNISFDSQKNPVSVNNSFFDRCTPGVLTGCAQDGMGGAVAKPGTSTCPAGPAELGGTGFGIVKNWCELHGPGGSPSVNGGSTGWLTSQAPIKGGDTFTIEFIIWDTGDGAFDSSIMLDNFAFVAGEVSTGTARPPN